MCSVSKLKLDINRFNTLRADIFCMQGKKERKKDVRIIVRLLLFILKFVCNAESIKFKTISTNRYENNIVKKKSWKNDKLERFYTDVLVCSVRYDYDR